MPSARSRIQQETRQSRPFRSPQQEAAVALLRTASGVRRLLARVVEAEGLSFAQYNVLRILKGAGAEGLPTLAIRERLVEEAPGITRLVDKLEAAGYLRRERGMPDRRQVLCRLTPAGRALLARLDPQVDAADEAAMAGLDDGQLARLVRLLDALRAAHLPPDSADPADRDDRDD